MNYDPHEGCQEYLTGTVKVTSRPLTIPYRFEMIYNPSLPYYATGGISSFNDALGFLEEAVESDLGASLLNCDDYVLEEEAPSSGGNIFDENDSAAAARVAALRAHTLNQRQRRLALGRRKMMSEGGIVGITTNSSVPSSNDACIMASSSKTDMKCIVVDGMVTTYLTESGYEYVDGQARQEALGAIRDGMKDGRYISTATLLAGGTNGTNGTAINVTDSLPLFEELVFLGVPVPPSPDKNDGAGSSSIMENEERGESTTSISGVGIGLAVLAGVLVSLVAYWFIRKKRLSEAKVY